MNVVLFGIEKWHQLFNERQLVGSDAFGDRQLAAMEKVTQMTEDADYANAMDCLSPASLTDLLTSAQRCACGIILGRKSSIHLAVRPFLWCGIMRKLIHSVTQRETGKATRLGDRCIKENCFGGLTPFVRRGNAVSFLIEEGSVDALITDPPYYDSVCYANLSDFFYVWMKRTLVGAAHTNLRLP